MRRTATTSLLLTSLFLLAGCAGFFERELGLAELPYERKLVLNTILSPQDSLLRADVYLTVPSVGDLPPDYPHDGFVTDASVTLLSASGTYPFHLMPRQSITEATYVLQQEVAQLQPGETYEVVAEWDGLVARGRARIPEATVEREAIVLDQRATPDDTYLRISWPNAPGEQDYYLVQQDEQRYYGQNRTELFRYPIDYMHGRDALGPYISSRPTSVTLRRQPVINVCRITRATFDYFVTRQTLQVNDQNPFAEPTTVANNLDEGLGVIGAANCTRVPVE